MRCFVVEALLAAIRAGVKLPATGTAHGHVRLVDGRLARIAYAYEDDPTAAARLHVQAEGFRHLQPAGRTPRLHQVIEPRPGLPGYISRISAAMPAPLRNTPSSRRWRTGC